MDATLLLERNCVLPTQERLESLANREAVAASEAYSADPPPRGAHRGLGVVRSRAGIAAIPPRTSPE